MLIEFYQKAQDIIVKVQPDILQRTESDTNLYVKADQITEELKQAFKDYKYDFAVIEQCDGYLQVLQPVIPYKPGDCYGHIPEDMLNDLNN